MQSSQDERFRSVYVDTMPRMWRIASGKGVPQYEIEDIMQEAALSYLRHYPLTWPNAKMAWMLKKITRNLSIDYKRRRATHPIEYLDPVQMQAMTRDKWMGVDALSILVRKQERERIVEAFCSMRSEWATVFHLYIIEGRPMEEVSKMLGISEAACRMRLMRGRKYLRESLEETEAREKRSKDRRPPETAGDSEVPGSA